MKMTFPKSVKTGEIVYLKTSASAVFAGDGLTVEEHLSRLHNAVSDHINLLELNLGVMGDGIAIGSNGSGGTIAQENTYTGLLGKHFKTYKNYSAGSVSIATVGNIKGITELFVNMDDNLDIIIFAGTTNDWFKTVPLGTIADTSITTYYGALHNLILGAQTKFAGKEIFITTPLPCCGFNADGSYASNTDHENGLGYTLKDYVEVLKEVCEFHAVPVIDLYSTSNMNVIHNAAQRDIFTFNGTHLRERGHQRVYRRIFNEILTRL